MNHCYPMNGGFLIYYLIIVLVIVNPVGMWGGVKGGIPNVTALVRDWKSGHQAYMEDMKFLWAKIYPIARESMYQTDSYCCLRFQHTHPFPYRRLPNFEHVGQVFTVDNIPRHTDIDNFLRIRENPVECRKEKEWTHG